MTRAVAAVVDFGFAKTQAAPGRGRLHSRTTRPRSRFWNATASRARAMREAISRSTARGATTCFSDGSRATRAHGGRPPDLSEIDLRAVAPTPSHAVPPAELALRGGWALRLFVRLRPAVRARLGGRPAGARGPVGQGFRQFRRHRPHPRRSSATAPRAIGSRSRPRPAPTASCAASRSARSKPARSRRGSSSLSPTIPTSN